jgi:DNA-binding NarL/FixJ family response regulator
MSKKRPRPAAPQRANAPGNVTAKRQSAQWWEKRVFKNTYTHNGKLVEVKGWSVKIQHQGRRRTFSLISPRRAEAAQEAAQLYRRIVKQGWPSRAGTRKVRSGSPQAGERSARDEPSRTSARYWENRLLQRRYPNSMNPDTEWAVRIEHEGIAAWFPLGTSDTVAAAAKALTIYRAVFRKGWEMACQQHPREVTLAIQWVSNPVTWTYTTFHTEMKSRPLPRVADHQPVLRVVVVEPDASLRRALQHWINLPSGICCLAACASAEEAIQRDSTEKDELWLVNRALPGVTGGTCLERVQQLFPRACALLYSVYEDSSQLFAATPGGASAYLLRRTPPEKLLEPILADGAATALTPQEILVRARKYFQSFLIFAPAGETNRALESLTNREREILQYLSKGYVDKEIAMRLGISAWTVHGHVKNIFQKLQVHTRTEAVVKLLQK